MYLMKMILWKWSVKIETRMIWTCVIHSIAPNILHNLIYPKMLSWSYWQQFLLCFLCTKNWGFSWYIHAYLIWHVSHCIWQLFTPNPWAIFKHILLFAHHLVCTSSHEKNRKVWLITMDKDDLMHVEYTRNRHLLSVRNGDLAKGVYHWKFARFTGCYWL